MPTGPGMPQSAAMTDDDVYTHGHHESVLRSHRWRTAENSAAYLLEHLRPGMRLLDVGCGPGTITRDLAARIAPGEVLGVDRAAVIVEQARTAGDDAVEFRVGDAYALDLPDASFDVVHAHQVLQHLTDPVAALREWRRVVRPDGVVAARDGDYEAFTWYPADPRLDRWLDLYRRAARANGAEPDAGRRLLAWAHAAGFTDVVPGASVWCYATPADRAWWAGVWADRIVESTIATQILAAGWADEETLRDIAAGWRAWADDEDAWFLVPHGEIIARRTS